LDSLGNAWVTGETESEDFPANALFYNYGGNGDTFVAKVNPTGVLLRSGYLGVSVHDIGYAVPLIPTAMPISLAKWLAPTAPNHLSESLRQI
jgi:hypothetical protein